MSDPDFTNLPERNQRREIREEVAKLLMFETDAGARVTPNRTVAVNDTDLPHISIYSLQETARIYSESPRIYDRELSLIVEIVTGGEKWDDEGDGIAGICEAIIEDHSEDPDLPWDDLILGETVQADEDDGRISVGSTRLIYKFKYKTRQPYSDPAEMPPFDPTPPDPAPPDPAPTP